MLHKLISKDIQSEVENSINKTGKTPLYYVLVYKGEPPELVKEIDASDKRQIAIMTMLASMPYSNANDYLHFVTGFIGGVDSAVNT